MKLQKPRFAPFPSKNFGETTGFEEGASGDWSWQELANQGDVGFSPAPRDPGPGFTPNLNLKELGLCLPSKEVKR